MFSRVLERISRLKRSSWPASSSTAITSASSMPEPRRVLVITRREDAAPIAAASRRSVNWIQLRSARVPGVSSMPWLSAKSVNARLAAVPPTTRRASACRSAIGTPRQSLAPSARRCAYGSRNGAARSRSSSPGRQRAETSSRAPMFNSSDQKVPWVSGSQPSMPNSWRGRSQPMPNGPRSNQPVASQPASVSVGSSRV